MIETEELAQVIGESLAATARAIAATLLVVARNTGVDQAKLVDEFLTLLPPDGEPSPLQKALQVALEQHLRPPAS